MSYGLALDLANAWEHQVREYQRTHRGPAIGPSLRDWILQDAIRTLNSCRGGWTAAEVANKACEILAERLGEDWKAPLPRKLV